MTEQEAGEFPLELMPDKGDFKLTILSGIDSILRHELQNAVLRIACPINAQDGITGNASFSDILIHGNETDFPCLFPS